MSLEMALAQQSEVGRFSTYKVIVPDCRKRRRLRAKLGAECNDPGKSSRAAGASLVGLDTALGQVAVLLRPVVVLHDYPAASPELCFSSIMTIIR